MKNELKPKKFLKKRNIFIAVIAVFLVVGIVIAIVVPKKGDNGGSQTSASESVKASESVGLSESFNRNESDSDNGNDNQSGSENFSTSERESISASERESENEHESERKSENSSDSLTASERESEQESQKTSERESERESIRESSPATSEKESQDTSESESEQESSSISESESEQTSEEHTHSFDKMTEEERYFASAATRTKKAKYYYSCECGEIGDTTFEVGELAEHTPVTDKGYAATCDNDGLTDGTHCSVCGAVITAQEIIPAVGHNYESGICSACDDVELTDNKYFTFTLLSDGGYSIGASAELKNSTLKGVKFPAVYNEQPVVSVAVDGFDGCQFTKLVVPEGIISLGESCFGNCDKLTSVFLPTTLTEVSALVFKNCTSLECVVIPDSVEKIGTSIFKGCSSLESLAIPFVGDRKNAIVTDSDIYSFGYIFGTAEYENSYYMTQHCKTYGSYSRRSFYLPLSLKYVTVTGGEILDYAFEGCTGLKKVDIPQNITRIGAYALCACGIESFEVPSGVTRIEEYTFSACDLLKEIKLPSGLKEIGFGAFSGCDSFVDIELPGSVEKIDMCAFKMCDRLRSVVIPNSATEILYGVFDGCESLESITTPCIGYNWGDDVFPVSAWFGVIYDDKYDSTKYYRIPRRYYDNVYGWESMGGEYIIIPLSFKSITITNGESVYGFEELSSLVNVTLPETVKRIESRAFLGCTNLKNINLPEGLEFIGEAAFADCKKLKTVELSDHLTKVETAAFSACEALENLKLGKNIIEISKSAFYGTALTSLELTSSIQIIGESAFDSCKNLHMIHFNSDAESLEIGKTAFGYCEALETLVLSNNIKKIGENAFKACTALKRVDIGNVETIEYDAFYKCENIESVNITDLSLWFDIKFGSPQANPVYYASGLTVNGKEISDLTIPSGVLNVGAWAFANCDSLKSVVIPSWVQTIDVGAFRDCDNITDIGFSDGLKQIGSGAFENCDGLINVVLPDSVTDINSAFANCKNLANIKLSAALTEIYYSAFRNCVSLVSIILPEKITNIGDEAFKGCSSLQSVLYLGTKQPSINFSYNEEFKAANKYFYSETPREGGNYWHYDSDGNPTIWR